MDFLAKLKLKAAADVGARLAAEKQSSVDGTVLVHLEKRTVHSSNLELDLGVTLSDSAEVRSVRAGSEAANNRLPVDHIVYSVNGVSCFTFGDVDAEVAKPVLGIDLKLFPLAPLRELLLQYQQLPDTEDLKFDVLQRNPRYGFLQIMHPANRTWKRMYELEREGRRVRHLMRVQLEAKKEEEALRHLDMLEDEDDVHVADTGVASPPYTTVPTHTVPVVGANVGAPAVVVPAVASRGAFMNTAGPAAMFHRNGSIIEETDDMPAVVDEDAAVLQQLIQGGGAGVGGAEADAASAGIPPPPYESSAPAFEEFVKYQLTPSKPYTLVTGEQVVIPVTTRTGALPRPPSAPMPEMTQSEYQLMVGEKRGRSVEAAALLLEKDDKHVNGGGNSRDGRRHGRDREEDERRRRDDERRRRDRHPPRGRSPRDRRRL